MINMALYLNTPFEETTADVLIIPISRHGNCPTGGIHERVISRFHADYCTDYFNAVKDGEIRLNIPRAFYVREEPGAGSWIIGIPVLEPGEQMVEGYSLTTAFRHAFELCAYYGIDTVAVPYFEDVHWSVSVQEAFLEYAERTWLVAHHIELWIYTETDQEESKSTADNDAMYRTTIEIACEMETE